MAIGEPGKQKFYPIKAGGPDVWKKSMLEKFPKEERALDKYLSLLKVCIATPANSIQQLRMNYTLFITFTFIEMYIGIAQYLSSDHTQREDG